MSLACLVVLLQSVLVVESSDDWLPTALKAWHAVTKDAGPTTYRCTITWDIPTYTQTEHYTFFRRNEQTRIERHIATHVDGKTTESYKCWVRNEDYSFELVRVHASDEWSLSMFVDATERNAASERDANVFTAIIDHGGIMVEHELLTALFTSPYVRDVKAEAVDSDGRELVKVSFRYATPKDYRTAIDMKSRISGGILWLDGNNQWKPVLAELQMTDGFQDRNYAFTQAERGAAAMDVVITSPNGARIHRHVLEINYDERLDPELFRLPSFGFPEPQGYERKRLHWSWVVGIGGVVCILIGWSIRRRNQEPRTI